MFLAGFHKAFLINFDSCRVCGPEGCCASSVGKDRSQCAFKSKSRPSMDAMGIDVYTTARNLGYKINVLTDVHDVMNRFALLLVV